jgi:steroid delta-isomerase-like uncharacterized protein
MSVVMTNEELVRSLYSAINQNEPEKFASLFSDDGRFKDVSSGHLFKGKVELRSMIDGWFKAFPDLKIQIRNVIGSGELFSVEGSLAGTHKGTLESPQGPIPATGKVVDVPLADVIHVKNGKIYAVSCYMASSVLMNQIGQVPLKKAA